MKIDDVDKQRAKLKHYTELKNYLLESGIGEYQLRKEAEVATYADPSTSAIFTTTHIIDRK